MDLDNGLQLIAKRPYQSARPGEELVTEARFYRETASLGELPIPLYIGEFAGTVVLEYRDLKPFSFKEGASEAHAKASVEALADWHAAFSGHTFDWLPNFNDAAVLEGIQRSYDSSWSDNRTRLIELLPAFAETGDALVGRLAGTLEPLGQSPTLAHGDAHAENLPLTDQGVLILDWQDPQIIHPAFDLAVFTTMSLPVEIRRQWERGLVDHHAGLVASKGYRIERPWPMYRLGVLRRAARIVEIASTDFVSLPWVFKRSAQAAIDLEASELIR